MNKINDDRSIGNEFPTVSANSSVNLVEIKAF